MPASTTAPRLAFLDGLRGIAIVLMVLNHTSRWWIEVGMGPPRYYLVYGSLLFPGAMFLFLVGFCLPLSYHARGAGAGPATLLARYGGRGVRIILAGILLNVLVFREDPVLSWGVLQTIGLSIVVLAPLMPLLRRPWAQWALLAVPPVLYLTFFWSVPAIQAWVKVHPLGAELWFMEFPPWPWLGAPLTGLVAGWWWLDARRRGEAAERSYFARALAIGIVCLAAYCAWEWLWPTTPGFGFRRDLSVNRHWTPRGASLLLIAGTVATLLAATWWAQEVRRRPFVWLVTLGRTALVVYFLHHLIVLTLVNQTLLMRFYDWPSYVLANLALLWALVWIGHGWLWLSPRLRALPARLRPAAVRSG